MECCRTCEFNGGCSLCEECENGRHYKREQIEIVETKEEVR